MHGMSITGNLAFTQAFVGGGCASRSCPRYIRFRRLFSALPAKAPSAIISRTASLCTYGGLA